MKKMKLTETELVNLIGKTIKEQSRLGSSLDSWDVQRDAEENGEYCEDYSDSHVGPRYFEGQYCSVETSWFDWESSTAVETTNQSASGKWKCGVGCMVSNREG
jgi:hypothetical protein